MRTAPNDLPPAALVEVVRRRWGIDVASIVHQPVGFGSHHWLADDGGIRWWITVDDLASGPDEAASSAGSDEQFADLRSAMETARHLGDAGCAFVVAPRPTTDGEAVVRVDHRYAAVVHPFVDGRAHAWGEAFEAEQRAAVVDVLAELHRLPVAGVAAQRADVGRLDHRAGLEAVCARSGRSAESVDVGDVGPYAAPMAKLIDRHRDTVVAALDRLDTMVADAGGAPQRLVLTHGEPHPGNLMEVDGRWVLIDWDTTRLAPPERDLWMLLAPEVYAEPFGTPDDGRSARTMAPDPDVGDDPEDRAPSRDDVLERYERLTGLPVDRNLLEVHRLRWQLADVAEYVRRFRSDHRGTADDDEAWTNLGAALGRLVGWTNAG